MHSGPDRADCPSTVPDSARSGVNDHGTVIISAKARREPGGLPGVVGLFGEVGVQRLRDPGVLGQREHAAGDATGEVARLEG